MAPTSSLGSQYANWPDPHEYNIPYVAPPKGANPSVKGTLLVAGAPLVEHLGFVSKYLYNNAGFNVLRKIKALEGVGMRFDPTVLPVPVATTAERADGPELGPADPRIPSLSLLKPSEAGSAPPYWSVVDYHNAYKAGTLTPIQVVETLLPLIRRDVANRSFHSTSFLTTLVDRVTAAAEASTQRWVTGTPLGILDGVPIAVKDEVELEGYPQTWGSGFTNKVKSEASSWCVAKWEEQGAVIVGKTNMHEIGMDTTNNNPTTGTPRNPYNERYYTGGSSGGSAYSVSAGLVPIALGSDGGGSIRIPSAYCGVFGLKTTHARISQRPTPDIEGTTCVTGPIACDMPSLEVAYRLMATPDLELSHSSHFPVPQRLATAAPRKKILGIFKPWFENSDPPVRSAVQACVDWLVASKGYEVVDISLPLVSEGQLAHALTIMLEGRYGYPAHLFKLLQPANRILMAVAAQAPASDLLAAQQVRQLISQHLAHLYETHGSDLVIVTPTTPNAGWFWKSKSELTKGVSDGDMTIRNMQYVWMANFIGNPAIQFPVGYVKTDAKAGGPDVPVGFMGMGIWGGEERLIELGYEGEQYLHDVVGRKRPEIWVDVIASAKGDGEKTEKVPADANIAVTNRTNGSLPAANGLTEKTTEPITEPTEHKGAVTKSVAEEATGEVKSST